MTQSVPSVPTPSAPGTPAGRNDTPPPSTPRSLFLGSVPDTANAQMEEARALVELGNGSGGKFLPLSETERRLRESLLRAQYPLAAGVYCSAVEIVSRQYAGSEVDESLGFHPSRILLPTGDTAEADLATTLEQVTLAPSIVYIPASAEDVRIVASGNPEGLQMRDIGGGVGSRGAAQLDALPRLAVGDDRTATDILAPMHLQDFGRRVLNSLNVLCLALDQLVTLEPIQNLAAAANPGSAMANALLRTALHRAQEQQAESHREWEVALREVEALMTAALRAVMAYSDSERSLTETREEMMKPQGSLDSVSSECQEARGERDEGLEELAEAQDEVAGARAEIAARPPAPPATRFRRLSTTRKSLDFGARCVHYIVSMGLNGDAAAFQEHVQAYFQRRTPLPYSVSLFVGRNSAPISVPMPASGEVRGLQVEVVLGVTKLALGRRLRFPRLRAPAESKKTPVPPPPPPSVPGRSSTPQANPAKTPKHIRFHDLPDDESDVPESLPQEATQDDYEMGSGNAEADDDLGEDLGNEGDDTDTDTKGLFYRAMDDDAEPPRSHEDLSKLLPADTELSDTAEDIVVHVSLRRDVLCEIIRRLLCLRSLDEVDWFRHVPEEYFERAYKRAEDSNWVISVEHPWSPIPTEPREPSESSDNDASDMEGEARPTSKARSSANDLRGGVLQMVHLPEVPSDVSSNESYLTIRGFPDYDVVPTSAAEVKNRQVISDYLDLVDGTAPGEDASWDTVFRNRHVHVLVMFNFRRAQWERDHRVVLDRTEEAQKKVYSERATRQRSWYKALLKLRAKVALLPARERKWVTDPNDRIFFPIPDGLPVEFVN
ncbi:hypothetical protein PHMEG_00019475 [Phytophthora megakarya]|uniref:Uncharacterized protein n=1 Tax=Phytophthora megakarya TaxID=4795 RepID=A0A225VRF9_9STRA|nr:hypothetical protein PHMEG_00019475 [Phytophthora megakarya]